MKLSILLIVSSVALAAAAPFSPWSGKTEPVADSPPGGFDLKSAEDKDEHFSSSKDSLWKRDVPAAGPYDDFDSKSAEGEVRHFSDSKAGWWKRNAFGEQRQAK